MTVCACYRERNMLDVSEPFPSRFQLSSSVLLLTEHSGWEKRQTSTYNHLLHFRRAIFIILRVHTVFAHADTHICNLELLRILPVTTKYLLCLKALQVISVIVSHLLFLAFCLSFSLFISLFLFFCECRKLVEIAGVYVCWCRDEGWSVHRSVTGKIMADNRVLMKVSGPGPTVFGVECCQGLWGSTLWVLSPCWRVETAGRSISLQKECMCKWNQFI